MSAGNKDEFENQEDFDTIGNGDFAADDLAHDELAADENWNAYDDSQMPAEPDISEEESGLEGEILPAAGKKPGRAGQLLMAAIIVIIGVSLFLHFGRRPSFAPGMAPPAEHTAAVAPAVQSQPPASTPVNAVMPTEVRDISAPPMPNTMTTAENSATTATATAASPHNAASRPAENAEAGTLHMPKMQDVMLKSSPASGMAAATSVNQESGHDTAALTAKIDVLMTRLDRLESDVQNLQARPETKTIASQAADNPAIARQISALQDSIAGIEKKLANRPAAQAQTAIAAPTPVIKKQSISIANESPEPQAQVLGAAEPPAQTPKPSKILKKWVLKGAQPGQAMVSQAGENDIRNVAVGDTLQGLGTITFIGNQNGRWVVTGSQGQISQ